MSNNKRKWEIEYEKFLNGEMDTKLQELEAKVNEKKANREEYEEFKKINKVKENIDKTNIGYDAKNDEFVDLVKSGILDPTKVTLTALVSAGSVASSLLTTEVVVAETETEKPQTDIVG